jgi:hypothetical protein
MKYIYSHEYKGVFRLQLDNKFSKVSSLCYETQKKGKKMPVY